MGTEDVDQICEYSRHAAGRRAQHAELRLAAAARDTADTRVAEARAVVDRERVVARGRISAAGGNPNVVLCERGIRTFETETRNTIDLAAIALARTTHLPVIADPSHGTGKQGLIGAVSRAAVAVGADGLIIEVHPCPERALSDGPQSLDFPAFEKVMQGLEEPLRRINIPGPKVAARA